MDDKILTDADLAAMEPRKYVKLERPVPGGSGKPVKVLADRILSVRGGVAGENAPAQLTLELHNRTGKPTFTTYNGTTSSLFEQFNSLGVRSAFLAFQEVQNPLSHMKHEPMQDSAVRVASVSAIRRPPGYRTTHGYKVRSVIERLDTQRPLYAADELEVLSQRLIEQKFKPAPGSGVQVFMLHPDQPALKDVEGHRLKQAKPPRRRVKVTQRTLI